MSNFFPQKSADIYSDAVMVNLDEYRSIALSQGAMNAPGMVSLEERKFLRWYAEKMFTGAGEIVDLGCWLGASTLPLLEGISQNPNPAAKQHKVYAYDRFIWEGWMPLAGFGTLYANGQSFVQEFRKIVAPWTDSVVVQEGDLTKLTWPGNPIEFLFIDAMKSWELARAITLNFFPHFVPGVSLLVQQDFYHYYESWIHLLMYRLRDYCLPWHAIPESSSFVFRVAKQMDARILEKACDFSAFDRNEIDAAFAYSTQLYEQSRRSELMAAKVMLYIHFANEEYKKAKHEGMSGPGMSKVGENLRYVPSELEGFASKLGLNRFHRLVRSTKYASGAKMVRLKSGVRSRLNRTTWGKRLLSLLRQSH
jgi:hypothetical protein